VSVQGCLFDFIFLEYHYANEEVTQSVYKCKLHDITGLQFLFNRVIKFISNILNEFFV